MFQRFHEMRERGERGFTLIELLVVILIIAILAAIAIPVFLNQRKKGWVSQMESSLKNAATAMETCATENNGSYETAPGVDCVPANFGYSATQDVQIAVTSADAAGFVLTATHTLHEDDYQYDSTVGAPEVVAAGP